MARYSCDIQILKKNGELQATESTNLVPGDVAVIPQGKNLPCDFILLTGSAIVNEAMLTGESIPVMKSSIPVVSKEVYSDTESAKHTLYSGTGVIQTR